MPSTNPFKFPGFIRPTTTPVPDEVFDQLMHQLSGAELKVLLYICRRTFGFKKDMDNISISQLVSGITTKEGKVLDKGTGLSKDSVARVVRTLEEKGVILRTRRQSAEKGHEATTYSLNFLHGDKGELLPPLSDYRTRDGVKIGQGASPIIGHTTNSIKQETEDNSDVVVNQLQNFGISVSVSKNLAKNYPEEYVTDKLALAQWLVDQGSSLVGKNPAGWLRRAVEDDFTPPRDYENPSERKVRGERAAKIAKAEAAQRLLAEQEYQKAKEEATKKISENHPPEPIGEDGLTTEDAWDLTLKRLEEVVPAPTYKTWIKDTMLISVAGQAAHVLVPNHLTAAPALPERCSYPGRRHSPGYRRGVCLQRDGYLTTPRDSLNPKYSS